MSSENIPQLEALTPRTNEIRLKRRTYELSNRQDLAPNDGVIELESDTDTNSQQKTNRNRRKRNKVSVKIDLNKITDQLVLIPNAKPPGSSWIWGYFEQYEPTEQYKRIVKCLAQVQRKNGAETCGHFMGSDNSTGNFIVHLATQKKVIEERWMKYETIASYHNLV